MILPPREPLAMSGNILSLLLQLPGRAATGIESEMLLNVLQRTGQSPQQRMIWLKMSMVSLAKEYVV